MKIKSTFAPPNQREFTRSLKNQSVFLKPNSESVNLRLPRSKKLEQMSNPRILWQESAQKSFLRNWFLSDLNWMTDFLQCSTNERDQRIRVGIIALGGETRELLSPVSLQIDSRSLFPLALDFLELSSKHGRVQSKACKLNDNILA